MLAKVKPMMSAQFLTSNWPRPALSAYPTDCDRAEDWNIPFEPGLAQMDVNLWFCSRRCGGLGSGAKILSEVLANDASAKTRHRLRRPIVWPSIYGLACRKAFHGVACPRG